MDQTARRTKLLTAAFTSSRGVMPALLDVIEYLVREARAEAWDECNAQWAKRGLTPDFENPYRD